MHAGKFGKHKRNLVTVVWGGWKNEEPGEKPLEQGKNQQQTPHTDGMGAELKPCRHGGRIETVPLSWELTTPTTAPSLLPYIVSQPGRAETRLILGVRTCYNHQWRKTKKTNKWR